MAELKDKNIEELLDEALEYTNNYFSLYDVKQVILSRFEKQQDKYKALMDECAGLKRRIINLVKLAVK